MSENSCRSLPAPGSNVDRHAMAKSLLAASRGWKWRGNDGVETVSRLLMIPAEPETRAKVETMIVYGARIDCGKCDCEEYRSGEKSDLTRPSLTSKGCVRHMSSRIQSGCQWYDGCTTGPLFTSSNSPVDSVHTIDIVFAYASTTLSNRNHGTDITIDS